MALMLIHLFFAVLFAISFVSKCCSYREFQYSIIDFGIIGGKPGIMITLCAAGVIASDLFFVIAFSMNWHIRAAYMLAGAEMIVFIGLYAKLLLQRRKIKCSCFGKSRTDTNIPIAIARNACFLLLLIVGIILLNDESAELMKSWNGVFLASAVALSYQIIMEWKSAEHSEKTG